MDAQEKFISISALICEPVRAKMLWNLLDGRAYTASELADEAGISASSASNHLSKLIEADIIKVESQGRHRYFSFSRPEVAYVVESLAGSVKNDPGETEKNFIDITGIKFCRTCYDHLAGRVGVTLTKAFEKKGLIKKSGHHYLITGKGWKWFSEFGISKKEIESNKRRVAARQCLDWSERKPHLAGQLGALLLEKMLEKNWFRKVKFSRELVVTSKARKEMSDLLDVDV